MAAAAAADRRSGAAIPPPPCMPASSPTAPMKPRRSHFSRNGVAARSIGAAGLGRRIYLGPFGTQGALDGARDLAVRAGFASPYPADF